MKNILITGGSGFIGTNLIDFYLNKGFNVLNVDIKEPQKKDHIPYWVKCDINNLDLLKKVVAGFQPYYVIHMAAKADLKGKNLEYYNTNIVGVKNIINVCNSNNVNINKIIFASSMLVCRVGYIPIDENDYSPPNLYAESKILGEKLIREESIKYPWTIVRPSSIWGPWFGPTYRGFFVMIMNGNYFNFKNKMSTKTYGYIGNTVYQIDALLRSTVSNYKTYYLGDYEPTKIKEWAVEISKLCDRKVSTIPNFLVYILALIGDFLNKIGVRFPMNQFRYKNMTTDNILPMNPTHEIAPRLPFTREEGNKLTIDWIKKIYIK